jgi:anti-anti-sigma regulatory factor
MLIGSTDARPSDQRASLPRIVLWEEEHSMLLVAGDEDRASQSRRRQGLSRALTLARGDVTVDLSGLVFADASLMLDLAMLARRLRKAGRELVVSGAQPQIVRLIELVGLHRLAGVVVR